MDLTQPQAVFLGASISALVALLGHGFNTWRDHAARKKEAADRRRERAEDLDARQRERAEDLDAQKGESESRRRQRAEDYQRQTLADLQEALSDTMSAAFEAALSAQVNALTSKGARAIERDEILESRKPVTLYLVARARAVALSVRVCDDSARKLAIEAWEKIESVSYVTSDFEALKKAAAIATSGYMKYCKRAGELIRAIDAGEPAGPPTEPSEAEGKGGTG